MNKTKIVVVGSSNTDMTIRLAHLPVPGETEIGGDFSMAAGGKGANQAVGAARAGGSVTLVARVGSATMRLPGSRKTRLTLILWSKIRKPSLALR
jgi:hypothetical protein